MIVGFIAPFFNFLVVVFILWKFGKDPVRQFFRSRSENIKNQMDEALYESDEAKRLLSQAESDWKCVETHAKQHNDETQASIHRFREQSLRAARLQAERIGEETKLVAQSELRKARLNLERELVQRSVRVAGKYLQSNLGEKEKHQLVFDYVETVGNASVG